MGGSTSWLAAWAIDSNPLTCSHTEATTDNPWWRVDLLDFYYISKVVITNRGDCCPERLDGAEIHIGNSLENNGNNNPRCAVLYGVSAGQSVSVSCHDMKGQYVNVIIPGSSKILTLAEVEVYKADYTGKTFVMMKFLSSFNVTDPAVNDTVLDQLNSTLTSKGLSNFTLTWTKLPQKVKQEIKLDVDDGPCVNIRHHLFNSKDVDVWTSLCTFSITAQSVYDIFGSRMDVDYSQSDPSENLALGGQAGQSSTHKVWIAAWAIDSNPLTFTHTAVTSNPWWRVDLLDSYYISIVVITNRPDCCPERLNGAEIHIGNSLINNGNNNPRCTVLNKIGQGQSVSVNCHNMKGRYVNVIIPGSSKILSLAEVEVYKEDYIGKTFVMMKIVSSVNVTDPAVSDTVLDQLKTALTSKGLSNFTLTWTKLPQKVEVKPEIKLVGPCVKEPEYHE
ncbi:uncharacterized protein [Paramisgurnus dabryanus]|uniref:uncharacterized protein n=1 Tax=Paramisgurnus dabryanus TaxID=90735 RepID=UPI003CCFBFE4